MFQEPPNEAVITLKTILEGSRDALYVVNDEEGWQFLSGEDIRAADALVVALQRVLDIDATLHELGDLPVDWQAWRATRNEPWQRASL